MHEQDFTTLTDDYDACSVAIFSAVDDFVISLYNQCTSQNNIHCVSGTEWGSSRWGYQDNHVNLTCGDIGYPLYTMIDCEGLTYWRNLRGSIINYDEISNSDICYVEKTVKIYTTNASLGYINCCDINLTNLKSSQNIETTNIIPSNTSISCTKRESTSTTTVYDTNSEIYYSTVECGINETLLSCHGVVVNDKRTYGTCIGRNCFITDTSDSSAPESGIFIPSDNVCHVTSKFNSNITAQAICCKLEKNSNNNSGVYYDNYDQDTTPAIGVESTRCYARNSGWSLYGIYSQALCCRFKGITPTLKPTVFPTDYYPTVYSTESSNTKTQTTKTNSTGAAVGIDKKNEDLIEITFAWEVASYICLCLSFIAPCILSIVVLIYHKKKNFTVVINQIIWQYFHFFGILVIFIVMLFLCLYSFLQKINCGILRQYLYLYHMLSVL